MSAIKRVSDLGTGGTKNLANNATFSGTAIFPKTTLDGTNGTLSTEGVGNFRTIQSNGRGVGIGADTADTSSILQFVNNAFSAQWARILATSTNTLTLDATNIATTTPITGSIAQSIHTIYTQNYSRTNTSGTPIDVTNWNATITPKKAGNKIIIFVQAAAMAICDGYLQLKRNGSIIASPLISLPRIDFSNDDAVFFAQYIDTAPSTASITYQMAGTTTGCTGFLGINSQGGVSSIILTEIQS